MVDVLFEEDADGANAWETAFTSTSAGTSQVDQDGWILPTPPTLLGPVSATAVDPNVIDVDALAATAFQASITTDSDSDDEIPTEGLDDDGFLLPNWAMDNSAIQECLLAWGLTGARLVLQRGDEKSLLQQVLSKLGVEVSPVQFSWHYRKIVQSVASATTLLPLAKRLRGDHLPSGLQGIKIQDQFWANARLKSKQDLEVPILFLIPPKGQRRNRLMAMSSQLTKSDFENMEKQKYFSQMIKLYEIGEAPIVNIALRTANPTKIFIGSFGDTRASTLRQYTRSLTAFQSWCQMGRSKPWPDHVSIVLEYIHVRTEEPCAPSIPQVFIKALAWFEKAGAFESERRFANNVIVQKTVDYSCEMLSAGIAPPKKAPRPPFALIAALELYVCDSGKPIAKRAKAFQLLIKTFCSLREDDVQNLAPKQFRFFDGILVNTLKRTKTSGPTKRVKELPVCLSADTGITDKPWLTTGLGILQSIGDDDRDFFLPNFTADLEGGKPGRLSYANSAALGQRLLSEITLPEFSEGKWTSTDKKLIPSALAAAFTEHGPRAFMPTILAELEVEKSQKDFVGRWSPTGSDDYTRSYRAVVKRLQKLAILAVRSLDPRLGQGDILERLTIFGETLELVDLPGHIQYLVENMELFQLSLKRASEADFAIVEEAEIPVLANPALIQQTTDSVDQSCKRQLTRIPQARDCKFLIIYSQGRRFARLHRTDSSCPWAYTLVRDCEETNNPKPVQYNARCKICFQNADSDTSNSEEEVN